MGGGFGMISITLEPLEPKICNKPVKECPFFSKSTSKCYLNIGHIGECVCGFCSEDYHGLDIEDEDLRLGING